MLIAAKRGLTPEGKLEPIWLRAARGRFTEAGTGSPPEPPDINVEGGILSPGFIDVHCHGGGGASFTEGADAARIARSAHLSQGTTTMLASLVSAPTEVISSQISALEPLVNMGELAGVHLEGPWLSPMQKGAHDQSSLSLPNSEAIRGVLTGAIRMVTIAPEIPGAIEAIRCLTEAGVVVAVGHTDASYEETAAALVAGAKAGTHLFNAMRSMHHRDPGPAMALLDHPDAYIELIADGVHVHPAALRFAFSHRPERFLLVSDAMAAAEAADGVHTLGALEVRVIDRVARLTTKDGNLGAIAGSTLTLAAAVRYSVQQAGIPLEQSLVAATETPARMLGLPDVGRLVPGSRADAVVLNSNIQVATVICAGEVVATHQRPD